MGVLSDFIAAPDGAGTSIGESVRPADHWDVLEGWKGIDPLKLATLHSVITSESLDVDPIVDKSETFQLVGGDETDGPWVLVFPDNIAQDIASLDPNRIDAIADAWSQTEELQLDGFTQDEAKSLITDLSALCRSAQTSGNKVYAWISL